MHLAEVLRLCPGFCLDDVVDRASSPGGLGQAWLIGVWLGLKPPHRAPFADTLDGEVQALHELARHLLVDPLEPLGPHLQDRIAPTVTERAKVHLALGGGHPAAADGPGVRAALHACLTAHAEAWHTRLASLPHRFGPQVAPLSEGLQAALAFLQDVAGTQALFAPPVQPLDDRTGTAAAAWLTDARIAQAVEHQAFGLEPTSTSHTETRWLAARIRLSLHRAGHDQQSALADLFHDLPPAPPRWYDHWDGIPPDADSLATWLEVAHVLGAEVPPAWWSLLAEAPGPSPTWFGPGGTDWGGPDCAAVRTRLTIALAAHPHPVANTVLEANLDDLLSRPPGEGSYHYPADRALGFTAELAATLVQHGRRTARVRAWAQQVQHSATEAILRPTPPSPMATASLVSGLASIAPQSVAIPPALRYLTRTQRPDGSWLAAPAFVIPGRPPHPRAHLHSRALTTAVCLEGWTRARAQSES